jgi:hypothetical protein
VGAEGGEGLEGKVMVDADLEALGGYIEDKLLEQGIIRGGKKGRVVEWTKGWEVVSNPAEAAGGQIGIFILTQVRDLFPIIGVMYAMHYQLLESQEAKDWLWIRSYIEPILTYDDAE